MSKPKANAKLLNLPEAQQAQLAEWLLDGLPYHKAQELVLKEFGVQVGLTAFTGFWEEVCAPALVARRRRMVGTAEEVATEAAASPGRFDSATVDALKQRAFELAIKPNADPKEVKAIFALVLKSRDQEINAEQLKIEERKMKLLEQKAALADQAEAVAKEPLSAEEQQRRIKEIFGIQ
jgi:hypothetical protein